MSYPFTVVAYISNGTESCRGCEIDSWDSSFESGQFEDYASALSWCKDLIKKELIENGRKRGGWDIILYTADGPELYYPNTWSDDSFSNELKAFELETNNNLLALKELKHLEERAQRERQQREKDLARLAELKAQYEGENA